MADEPVIIKGGSLEITISGSNGTIKHSHPSPDGTLTSVEIDGETYDVNPDSQIIIHYDVPDELIG
ncbi:MAG: hypothetical protein WCD76_11495 [Pyrinomonadaceae bacterium]